ncbi:vanadium-dependent haloperoxidase [Solirubrobacter sp. CPCC 204708]|uniref:Vanadium-dependent haloperoxidase n=1 Tax=Solirubrobacter deserti TaxID=2282478 RepID=A0ABT4RF75_9ACTN|nr:vanadium-dependent haloperoxidase [Solirubrobacter deserti]MBE2319570.1 vanadium-dependent haloperoxidase [Solirubrobacter deserti]MDA0137143.1 vanadium-dependent haloperoxidase [Solirubrobacter deserti]
MKRAMLAFCMAVIAALAISEAARADTVTDWNVNAVSALVGTAAQSPTVSTVHLSMVHGAVFDAVNSIDGRYEPYVVDVRARDWYSRDAAAATAAYKVLLALVPAQAPTLGAQYEASMGAIPAGPARDGGARVGAIAAAAMLQDRDGDGRYGTYRFPAPASSSDPWPVGQWRPVLPAFGNDPGAWVKDVRPFLVEDPKRFARSAPHPLTSRAYARELAEVKAVGALDSTVRTADQTDQARFWAEGPQPFTRAARVLAAERRLRDVDTARMFAMLYMTAADTAIATWNGKAKYTFWRPITAIRGAADDGNAMTEPDAGWLPLINTPAYPEHPSGLSSLGAAMAVSLERVFGHRARFTMNSTTSGTTRDYRGFAQAVDEIVDARVFSGIHFRKADEDGAQIGVEVAREGLARHFERDF